MSKQGNIPAFTLMELTVGIFLTSIVVSMAFFAYSILNNQYHQFRSNTAGYVKLAHLHDALLYDVHTCREVLRFPEGMHCRFTSGNQITYRFEDGGVMRTSGTVTDTFALKIENLSFRYLGNEQYLPDGPVDALSFSGVRLKEELPFHYYKNYGAAQLLAWEEKR